MTAPSKTITDETIDSPTAWFAVLERARRTNNSELAAKAEAELSRLGVSVNFASPVTTDGTRSREEVRHA